MNVFNPPALQRRADRPYTPPDPLRPITEGQARRLWALACRENVHTDGSFGRMLRYYGFFSAGRVRSGAYERLCEIALDPIAAQLFQRREPLPGERPWLASEPDEGAFLRGWTYRTASDDFLQRQVAVFASFALAPSSDPTIRAEIAHTVRAALREIRFRMAARAAMLADVEPEEEGVPLPPTDAFTS